MLTEIKAEAPLYLANVEQELFISKLIGGNKDFEVEGFYDIYGDGNAGLTTEVEAISLGL